MVLQTDATVAEMVYDWRPVGPYVCHICSHAICSMHRYEHYPTNDPTNVRYVCWHCLVTRDDVRSHRPTPGTIMMIIEGKPNESQREPEELENRCKNEAKCTTQGCARRRQYDEGCVWTRCCGECSATNGMTHDEDCDERERDPEAYQRRCDEARDRDRASNQGGEHCAPMEGTESPDQGEHASSSSDRRDELDREARPKAKARLNSPNNSRTECSGACEVSIIHATTNTVVARCEEECARHYQHNGRHMCRLHHLWLSPESDEDESGPEEEEDNTFADITESEEGGLEEALEIVAGHHLADQDAIFGPWFEPGIFGLLAIEPEHLEPLDDDYAERSTAIVTEVQIDRICYETCRCKTKHEWTTTRCCWNKCAKPKPHEFHLCARHRNRQPTEPDSESLESYEEDTTESDDESDRDVNNVDVDADLNEVDEAEWHDADVHCRGGRRGRCPAARWRCRGGSPAPARSGRRRQRAR